MIEAQMKLEHLLDHYERLEKSYPHYVSRIPNQIEATMIEINNYPEIYQWWIIKKNSIGVWSETISFLHGKLLP